MIDHLDTELDTGRDPGAAGSVDDATLEDLFWGPSAEWASGEIPVTRAHRPAGARRHGSRPTRPRALDQRTVRWGLLAATAALAVPVVAGAMSSSSGPSLATASADAVVVADAVIAVAPMPEAAAPASPAPDAAAPAAPAPAEPATTTAPPTTAPATAPATTVAAIAGAAEADVPAARIEVPCQLEYTIVPGDYWLRLADASGVALADLLARNEATVDTPMHPGDTICLPAGATVPAPPPAPEEVAPATTATPTVRTPAPTTAPPTTAPPTTATPTTAAPASPAEVEQIIREVWPDELEDRAIEVARRESNLIPTVRNWCCYGLFQIYWSVHRSWLGGLGVTSAEQLYDARTNATAAYQLYQRSGGWGPWGG